MKVLIADDDAVSRRLLQSYLQKWGYEVTAAGDGAEAWRLFGAGSFPVVITDWMMPEIDGVELVRRIRAGPASRPGYVYAILLTAKSQKEDLVEGMEAGADDFLTKPFDRDELRVRLRAGERIILLEQNLREARAALIQAEKLAGIGRLAAGVAHEVNNPIAFVNNNLAVLRRDVMGALAVLDKYREGRPALAGAAPEVAAEAARLEEEIDLAYVRENLPGLFERSSRGLQRVREIVQNLRDFVRLDEAEFKAIDLNEALRSTIQAISHELGEKSIRLEAHLADLPPVSCHPGKINQLFHNILQNAVQASGREGVIEVRTQADNGAVGGQSADMSTGGNSHGDVAVIAEVRDHGCGIKPEHLPHIFEPFFTTRPVGEGAGLGLSVSYGIARDHGGRIDVESTPGLGSLFRVRLPLRMKDEPVKDAQVQ